MRVLAEIKMSHAYSCAKECFRVFVLYPSVISREDQVIFCLNTDGQMLVVRDRKRAAAVSQKKVRHFSKGLSKPVDTYDVELSHSISSMNQVKFYI